MIPYSHSNPIDIHNTVVIGLVVGNAMNNKYMHLLTTGLQRVVSLLRPRFFHFVYLLGIRNNIIIITVAWLHMNCESYNDVNILQTTQKKYFCNPSVRLVSTIYNINVFSMYYFSVRVKIF